MPQPPIQFCDDAMLNYASSRRIFRPGETLDFDESYRLTHLPMVAPGHPAVIREVPHQDYRNGTYLKPRYSLVMPVRSEELTAAPAFRTLDREMRDAPFAPKVAWDLCERRAAKLHASIVNDLAEADAEPCAAAVARVLPRLGPLAFRLGGPFVGARNTGRLYFPVYPQQVASDDSFALIQDAVGAARTRFYGIGYYHLIAQLDARETAELARILRRWSSRTLTELSVGSFVVHATNDNLALSGRPFISIDAKSGVKTRHG